MSGSLESLLQRGDRCGNPIVSRLWKAQSAYLGKYAANRMRRHICQESPFNGQGLKFLLRGRSGNRGCFVGGKGLRWLRSFLQSQVIEHGQTVNSLEYALAECR